MTEDVLYAPLGGFLRLLCDGWRFPGLVVEPLRGHHGAYSCLLVREVPA